MRHHLANVHLSYDYGTQYILIDIICDFFPVEMRIVIAYGGPKYDGFRKDAAQVSSDCK